MDAKVIFLGYGYRWLRSKDVMDVTAPLQSPEAICPVLKQMLGWTHTNNGIFGPAAEDGEHVEVFLLLLRVVVQDSKTPYE